MSPEVPNHLAQLLAAEHTIRALEALVVDCRAKGLDRLAAHIQDSVTKCQADYIRLQRELYETVARRKPPKPKH